MATEIWVNIGSGNGLLPDGTKPLPEPMMTDRQWNPVTFILGQFHKRCLNHQSLISFWKLHNLNFIQHYTDVMMTTMAYQITSLTVVYSTVYSDADQRKHQSSASLAFLCVGNSPGPVNSPHKGPVMRKMFPFDDVIMSFPGVKELTMRVKYGKFACDFKVRSVCSPFCCVHVACNVRSCYMKSQLTVLWS